MNNRLASTFLIALTAFAVTAAAKRAPSVPITGRSPLWDQMQSDHYERHKRQTEAERPWQHKKDGSCTLGDVRRFDTLKRRVSGILSDVGDQGDCGSCWAFGATHALMDSRNIQAGHKLSSLSPLYTARCASRHSGYGCCGDTNAAALNHFRDVGIVTAECLPYDISSVNPPPKYKYNDEYKRAHAQSCFTTCTHGTTAYDPAPNRLHDYKAYNGGRYSDDMIIDALRNGHVVIVSIVSTDDLQNYRCGILTSKPPLNVNCGHSMVIVDYGTDTDINLNFWVMKNSWGTNYGESGYIRVRRGEGDLAIGRRDIAIPMISQDTTLPQSDYTDAGEETCAPVDISDPQNDNTTMSAVLFALQALASTRNIKCPNGVPASSLTLISFEDADIQIVAGMMVDLRVVVSADGCEIPVDTETYDLTVFINLDGTFTLTYHGVVSHASTIAASTFLLFVLLALSLIN